MKPLRGFCIAEGKGLNCRPFPHLPRLEAGQPSLRSGPVAVVDRFSCDSDQPRAQSENQRRFAPASLIGYWRSVIGIRGER